MHTGEAQDRGSSSHQARWIAWDTTRRIRLRLVGRQPQGHPEASLTRFIASYKFVLLKLESLSTMRNSSSFFSFYIIKMGHRFRRWCHPETASHSEAIFWVAVSAWGTFRKMCPALRRDSGTRFPKGPLGETVSHSEASNWDDVSGTTF